MQNPTVNKGATNLQVHMKIVGLFTLKLSIVLATNERHVFAFSGTSLEEVLKSHGVT